MCTTMNTGEPYKEYAIDNCWNVLDKIIQFATHFPSAIPEAYIDRNDKDTTVVLHYFAVPFGFTKEMHDGLFKKQNRRYITHCELHHKIRFENKRQGYMWKKLTFESSTATPLLYYEINAMMSMNAPAQEAVPVPVPAVQLAAPAPAPEPAPVQGPAVYANQEVLVNIAGKKHISVKLNNRQNVEWFRIRSARSVITKWKHFNRVLPKSEVKHILKVAAGSVDQGAYLLARQLHSINSNAVAQAMQSCGAAGLRKQTPEETWAMMDDAGISDTSCRTIGRHLRALNNNKAVICSYKERKKTTNRYTVQPRYGKYRWFERVSPTSLRHKPKRARYWIKDIFASYMGLLKQQRSAPAGIPAEQFNIVCGEVGAAAFAGILGDHGGARGKGTIVVCKRLLA